MPYRRNNYSLVIDSSFSPFSMQEMLVPFSAYKETFEKDEAAYNDLTDKADTFKYLSETLPENSRARQIYEGYANTLAKQAEDLAKNGLSMGNRRALSSLKRRYQGEIGRLAQADIAMNEEKKLRRQMNAQDSSMLYAIDNLSIDDFLDNNNPNLYNISGNELYKRGAQAGQSASSRIYSSSDGGTTLGGYYRKWVERNGYSPESINAFRANAATIPELQQAADAILTERGVTENLTGSNLERARQSVINGIIDGAVYQEKVNPVRDAGVLDASARASLAAQGYEWKNGELHYDPKKDPAVKKAEAIAKAKIGNGNGGRGSSSEYTTLIQNRIRVSWNANNPNNINGEDDDDVTVSPVDNETEYAGKGYTYDALPQYAKNKVDEIIGTNGNYDNFIYFFRPYKAGKLDDTEAMLDIVPRKIVKDNAEDDSGTGFGIH